MEFLPSERIRTLKYRDEEGHVRRRQLVGWWTDGHQIIPAVINDGTITELHAYVLEIDN